MADLPASAAVARPDPDQLIEQLRQEREGKVRGRLRIYFGAGAGVGKTYAMLSAAQRLHGEGGSVLVGVIETHGRSETAALLAGLPQLQPLSVAYRGRTLREFDLDAALAAHPAVLLVDELAHSNVKGSRHPKRWQDVEELLEAGIDVWSALNVQHLESLNGTVGAITGIRVHETVPDTVLDAADEMVLVDVTPDELTARLRAGKVYLPQQAEYAAQNFFRKGNLIALREIALRRTAEHVEDDVRSWRVEQSVAPGAAASGMPVWNTSGAILVGVGPRDGSEHAVRSAARLAGQLNVQWHVAYVETPRLQRLPAATRDRILAVLKLAEELGAATAVLAGADVAGELVRHAQEHNCAMLVVGRGVPGGWRTLRTRAGRSLVQQVALRAPALDVVEMGRATSARSLARAAPAARPAVSGPEAGADAEAGRPAGVWPRYAGAVGASLATALLAWPLHYFFDLANIVMVFLLGVVLVAVRFGRGPAALAAVLNVVAFDFFFVTPQFSLAVGDAQYLVTFVVMLGVGLLTGQLTAGLRFQARIAAAREERARALFELSRDLSAALQQEQVTALGEAAVGRTFGGTARVLPADLAGHLPALDPADAAVDGIDAGIADWAFRRGESAGFATGTLPAHPWHYVPLHAPMRVRGVLALRPAQPRWLLIPEQRRQLDTLARQIAIALERVHYVEVAQQAVVDVESERLRNTLLAAISHDVRTPLTALIGLAESLGAAQPPLPPAQAEKAGALAAQARALHALVDKLLDMARLQSGSVRLHAQWHSVEETVGSAIRAAQPALAGAAVQTRLPDALPLVEFDAVLVERLLVNLLENAAKYGAPPIVVAAVAEADSLELSVRDHGPGLPPSARGNEAALFDKFTRGHAESSTPGVGLGLAICQAIATAHGGSIAAAQAVPDAAGGGAVFTVRLPRRAPPDLSSQEEDAPARPDEPGTLASRGGAG